MLLETIKLALTAIWRNALRSVLTLLGITIGVAAVIALVTLGQGTSAQVSSSISSLGSNLLFVTPGAQLMGRSYGIASFRQADVEAVRRQVASVLAVAPIANKSLTVIAGANKHTTAVDGIDNELFSVLNWQLAEGRMFREGELRSGAAACIIGKTLADQLFPDGNVLGRTVRTEKLVCTIIGQLVEKGGGAFGNNPDDVLMLPLSTFQHRLAGNEDVSVIYVAAADEQAIAKVQTDLTALLRQRRHLSASDDNDFTVTGMRQLSSMLGSVMNILTGLLAAVASISLLVGGIGIMNIMLVSVTERTREIGIRLAIGARETQVLAQFLVEAAALSTFGGVIGIGVGLGVAAVGAHFLGVQFVLDPAAIVLAFGFSAVVGVGFGYFPARRAARLNPIEALRHE